MRKFAIGLVFAVTVLAAAPMLAQFGGPRPPQFNFMGSPVVGSGASYDMVGKDKVTHSIQIAIVGKEDSNGHEGVVFEYLMDQGGQPVVMQMLMVNDGTKMQIARMVVQPPGQGAMELPTGMMNGMGGRGRGQSAPPAADPRAAGERVGTESVTTPAGTFECEHWRNKDGSGDVWVSPKAGPWGLVKSVSPDSSMVVTKVITDAKSHITGPITKFDPMSMGRGRGQ